VTFREGEVVRAGQELFQLDSRPFRAALDQASATLAKDRAQAEAARLNADRAHKLVDRGLLSQADWDQARTAAASAVATVSGDVALVHSARLNLEYASIRAPIGGRTGKLLAHQGDYVKAASSDALVTINQIHPILVQFTVPESAVPMVQRYRNQHPKVLVQSAAPDSSWLEGELTFVDNAVDQASGTLLLKGRFANQDGRLVPGQLADVRFVLYEEPRATVVPAPAVTTGQQGAYVYVLNRDSTVTLRPVAVERTVDEFAVVTSGLQVGETVVTDGQFRLSTGSKVLVRKEAAKPL